MTKVLIVDSDERVAATLGAMLASEADDTRRAANPTAARQALRQGACDILIVALGTTLEQIQERLTLCARVKLRTPTTTVILVATDPAVENVLQTLGGGIADHLASGDSAASQVRALVRRLVRRQAQRHAKIVCTIGPASDSEDNLSRLIDAGMDVARLNFSHGDWDWHRMVCERIRRLADHVAIMADLQGPKLRIGHMENDAIVPLRRGATFTLTSRPVPGSEHIVSLDYPDLPRDVAADDTLYLDDGLIELRVLEVRDDTDIVCQVQTGGRLSSRKGIHAPRAILGMQVPTAKDRQDIELAVELDVDFLAVSFVAEAEDVRQVRAAVQQAAGGAEMPLTWEFGSDVSWVEVGVADAGAGRARLTLTHIAHLSEHWDEYGPGAAGVGWEMGLLGLAIHIAEPDAPMPDEEAFATSPAGKAFMTGSSEAWGHAAVAAGTDRDAAQAAAKRTTAFYTGEPADPA